MNTYLTSLLVDLLAPVARKRRPRRCAGARPATSRGADREQRTGALPRVAGRARDRHVGMRDHARRGRHGTGVEDRREGRERPAVAANAADARSVSRRAGPVPHLARPAREVPVPGPRTRPEPDRPRHPDARLPDAARARSGRRRGTSARRSGARQATTTSMVYYAKAPLVPYLRSAELRQARVPDCAPRGAAGATRPGTGALERAGATARADICVAAGRERAAGDRSTCSRASAATTSPCFAATPPLLYHNDLSATVSRFYWSEDAGYALWLRLYEAVAR